MTQSIKLTMHEMRMISLFQKITKVTPRDCLDDEKQDRLIFVVNEGKMGLSIGKNGSNIKSLQNLLKRNIELVEYFDDPIKFLENVLNPKLINEVKMGSRPDGSKQAIVLVNPSDKGLVVGRAGRNAEKARLLAKRYFDISSVMIVSHEITQMEV